MGQMKATLQIQIGNMPVEFARTQAAHKTPSQLLAAYWKSSNPYPTFAKFPMPSSMHHGVATQATAQDIWAAR